MKQEIKQLSQIEHVLHRPSMYVGSIVKEKKEEFILNNDKFELGEREYVPALIKIFYEIIDNSVDEFVRTHGKFSNKINIKITKDSFECIDNGRGIPNTKMKTLKGDMKYQAEVAFTEMLSGANYDNDDEATIGTNGLGSKAASIFSKKSKIINKDGKLSVTIVTKDNLGDVSVSDTSTDKSGVHTKIWPDLGYFGLSEIDDIHMNIIRERLLHLSISYPEITFKFNNTSIRLKEKDYFGMFNAVEFIKLNDNVSIAISHSPSEQFEHFSLINGLVTKSGGTHINLLSREVVNPIREKLVKKFKTIKPGDIKTKLRMIAVFKEFKNARYTSQTKEEITNSEAEIKKYLGDYSNELDKLVKKVLRNDDIMLPITELFLLKEEAKRNAELKKLSKVKKRIKSEKYYPATTRKRYLMIVEGESAFGGLSPVLGRAEIGYFCLKGKPLNAYSASQSKFTQNKELSELYQIIVNEDYEKIIMGTDQDLDGFHIRALLLGFFERYLPEYKGRIGVINTPVKAAIKNDKMIRWVYGLQDNLNLKSGESLKYFKGLGTHTKKTLGVVVEKDGLSKMIDMFEWDDLDMLDDWLSDKKADVRKEYIMNNEFSIAKL